MSTNKQKLEVLSILMKNLQQTEPQLVPSNSIAGQLKMNLAELHQVLKCMEGMGVIETDPDLQYNLITKEGLQWFRQQRPHA